MRVRRGEASLAGVWGQRPRYGSAGGTAYRAEAVLRIDKVRKIWYHIRQQIHAGKGCGSMADSIHQGHRRRMRERFLKTEQLGYQPHELLEILLYYGIPRVDTNPIAHELLNRFGSLRGVLSADPDQLKQVRGMTETAVCLITLLRAMYAYDAEETYHGVPMESYSGICDYFVRLYRFERRETVRAAFLDTHLKLLSCEIIGEGHPTGSEFSVRRLTECAYAAGSNVVVLAHNHPQGSAAPSDTDIAVTRQLAEVLRSCGISLADHVIVGGGEAVSLREYGVFMGLD